MYCRLARCEQIDEVKKVVHDLRTGYGNMPSSIQRLVQYHELRVAVSSIDVVSMTIDEEDVVIRTKDCALLQQKLTTSGGTLRQVGNSSGSGIVAMYYRTPNKSDSKSLLSELHYFFVESSCLT